MALTNIATVTCKEVGSGDEALVIVDAGSNGVRVCLSLRHGSDTEALLSVADARHVQAALTAAIAAASAARSAEPRV